MTKRYQLHILLIIGLLAGIFSAIMLDSEPDMLQYMFTGVQKPSELRDGIEDVKTTLGDTDAVLTVYTDIAGMSLSAENDTSAGDIELYMVGERYNEVFAPKLIKGDFLSYDDIQCGKRNIVISQKAAFSLFGDEEPLNRKVQLNGKTYTVVGIVSHSKRLGEMSSDAAYIPLGCDDEMKYSLCVLAATKCSGIEQFFEEAAEGVYGAGELTDLGKEKMRGFIIIRWILLVVFIRLAVMFFRYFLHLVRVRIGRLKERLEREYFKKLVFRCILEVLTGCIIMAAALVVCYLAMSFFIRPLTVFTEWVPDNLVSFASIRNRFYELCADNAEAVRYTSRELAEIRLWSNVLRWCVLSCLTGLLMTIWSVKRKPFDK